jgi:hypothetical protein
MPRVCKKAEKLSDLEEVDVEEKASSPHFYDRQLGIHGSSGNDIQLLVRLGMQVARRSM